MEQYDLIIIGAGPAGITAGIYASRKKLKTLLITKEFLGQVGLTSRIENYPGFPKINGKDLLKNFYNHLTQNEIEIKNYEEVVKIKELDNKFKVKTEDGEFESLAIIFATGAVPKKLAIKNEEKFLGRGLSYCLTCDAKAFEGKKVAVIGGGNAGAQSSVELLKFASEIYLLEYLENLTCDEILKEEIINQSKIKIITGIEVLSFEGEKELKKIVFKERKTGEIKELEVEGCFVEIGTKPNTELMKGLVNLNEKGEIIVNPKTMATSKKGIFAAGDVCDFPYKQIVLATGEGALAALSSYSYLKNLKK
ncbi:MAG TPA: FAD-dependent oxidoreductase [Candidatus Paceibacterota bacterium]|nr:FAD-dependent oxidoreductase [Candidatus Paceibacterota bacterium]